MALTISTHPAEVITNAPEFTVTTSLTEGASYQNLRIRATVYMGGVSDAVAVLEQPKGLDDWDLFDLLKSLTGKCNHAVGGSDIHIQPTMGSELLTAWTEYDGDFATFTTSGREITAATTTSPNHDYAQSNDLGASVVGDIYVVGLEYDYVDNGAVKTQLVMATGSPFNAEPRVQYAGLTVGELNPNHIYFFYVRTADVSPRIQLGNDNYGIDFAGTFTVHKISDFKNNPGVYFTIKFEEVYENVSDVTTIGDEEWADTLLFIPASVHPGEDFDTDYMIDAAFHDFLTRASDLDKAFKYGIGMELRVMYAGVSAWVRAKTVVDAGSNIENDIPNAGWGMLAINSEGGYTYDPDADDETIGFILESIDYGGGIIYTAANMSVNCETRCFPDIRAVSFVGDLGEEIILFRGLLSEVGSSEKSFYQNQNRIRKVLKAYKRIIMTLRTIVETEDLRRLIYELIYTEQPVWMYDSDEAAGYKDVTVVSDSVRIKDRNELIDSEIDIEYYE